MHLASVAVEEDIPATLIELLTIDNATRQEATPDTTVVKDQLCTISDVRVRVKNVVVVVLRRHPTLLVSTGIMTRQEEDGFTHVVAPVDARVVGTGDTTAGTRARAVLGGAGNGT